jgi:hypothetical protein
MRILSSSYPAITALSLILPLGPLRLLAAPLSIVKGFEWQPFAAQVQRLIEAADFFGSPFSPDEQRAIATAMKEPDSALASATVQEVLDAHCLFGVNINPEMRVKVVQGTARPELVEQGWRLFLVKVQNEAGTTAELRALSPNAVSVYEGGPMQTASDKFYRKRGENSPAKSNAELWLDLETANHQPLKKELSGLALEYRMVQLYSRDAGQREAKFEFNVGQGTQDLGFRNEVDVLFDCQPAHEIVFGVRDESNQPTTAAFLIRDQQGRVYPSQAKRLAPDFGFHPQVYRADGDTLKLPAGRYTIEFSRGPESIPKTETVKVDSPAKLDFKVQRWIDPSKFGWWSGDHHIHAAGCAHYVKPTEGVRAEDMIRHCMGEDLKVGANLTWGPCFDYQKQFFCGAVDKVSQYPYLLRYDIEVSGFGSHNSGHLCLLRLKDEIYPGGDSKDHWPTLCLNTLRWAKKQGAVCGPAHSGWGLQVEGSQLPNYNVPKFDGIGANEYIVDVTHEVPGPDGKPVPAVDFLSMVDTPSIWELNIWYQTLNAGFRTRVSGETDFPCIYGERVGIGRSYVKLDGKLDYDQWCESIRQGRNYVSDGRSHLMEFKVGKRALGQDQSEFKLAKPGSVQVTARVAARLNEKPDPGLQRRPYDQKPYWDIERARLGETREVPVELIVNGQAVAKQNILADGTIRDVGFDVKIERSSWVALRILPSSHTNPIFVLVDGKPIRASRRSAEWCLRGVDQCWSQKERHIRPAELEDAKQAYEHARLAYRKIVGECDMD